MPSPTGISGKSPRTRWQLLWGFQEDGHLWAGDRKTTLRLTLQWTHLQVTDAAGTLSLKAELKTL